jgi:hypothetical protein
MPWRQPEFLFLFLLDPPPVTPEHACMLSWFIFPLLCERLTKHEDV